jgi:hypothetical protein
MICWQFIMICQLVNVASYSTALNGAAVLTSGKESLSYLVDLIRYNQVIWQLDSVVFVFYRVLCQFCCSLLCYHLRRYSRTDINKI